MTRIPTRFQILHVRRLLWFGLYGIPMIARTTGVPIRDVFRIEKAMFPPIAVGSDGAHRLAANG